MKIISVLVGVFVLLACRSGNDKRILAIKTLPSFKMTSLVDGSCINSNQIPSGKPIVFFYYDPECDHCKLEAAMLGRHLDELKAASIYMVTQRDSVAEIRQFASACQLDRRVNISFVRDSNYSFFGLFLPSALPFMAIYDREKKLRRIFIGEVDVPSIAYSLD
jgi:hypothetical protein